MGQVVWTEKATSHLQAIHEYIKKDSPTYANNFVKSLVLATLRLEEFPLSGRIVPEFENTEYTFREVIYKGYRIVYRIVTHQTVEILSVMHGRKDFESRFNEEWEL
jgi:toxin ParE1/3/4